MQKLTKMRLFVSEFRLFTNYLVGYLLEYEGSFSKKH
jgi:hypothetical protein